jgi:hypothetical protein
VAIGPRTSLTRGDGGQNEIGPEFDEKLGVAPHPGIAGRAAVWMGDGSSSRGRSTLVFSKTPEETLTFWDRQQVLGDVVRVIRQFRPDVVVTRFPIPPGSGGHGHHTASGILAVEAFKLAGDPQAYPEHLRQGLNRSGSRSEWYGTDSVLAAGAAVGFRVRRCEWILAGNDPLTGEAFGVIARAAVAACTLRRASAALAVGQRLVGAQETFTHLGGSVAEKDLFDGVDTSWARVGGGEPIGAAIAAIVAAFKLGGSGSFSARAAGFARPAWRACPMIPSWPTNGLSWIVLRSVCLGLEVASRAAQPEVVPGETLAVTRRFGSGDASALPLSAWARIRWAVRWPLGAW